jgi:hypothetical protein
MRKSLLIPLGYALLCTFILLACKEKTASSASGKKVDSAYLFNNQGLGDLRIGMTVEEVEKALGNKVTLMNKNPEEVYIDSAEVKYKGEPATLMFDRRYSQDESYFLVLGGVKTSSPKFKTAAGIGVGSDKEEIWEAYSTGYVFNLYPDYEDTTYTTFSKTRSFINVSTQEGEIMYFFSLKDNKVSLVEMNVSYNDEE